MTEIIFPREIAKQGMKTVEYSLFFLIAAELVILIVILFVIEVIILNPISDISRHTKQIEAGNYELRLGLNRKDDIGEFADSFDKMVERIELQTEQLERLSSVDGLTGLCNRRIFDEALSREWKRRLDKKQYLSVILCDVDFFKLFNDNYGHRAGDESLQLIADSIRAVPKKASSFAARYGGEEFVILLPNTSPEEAKGIAENIRKKVEGLKIQHKKSEVSQYVTLSLGVASVVPNQQIVPGDLVETADQALYQSKKEGRNTTTSKKILS